MEISKTSHTLCKREFRSTPGGIRTPDHQQTHTETVNAAQTAYQDIRVSEESTRNDSRYDTAVQTELTALQAAQAAAEAEAANNQTPTASPITAPDGGGFVAATHADNEHGYDDSAELTKLKNNITPSLGEKAETFVFSTDQFQLNVLAPQNVQYDVSLPPNAYYDETKLTRGDLPIDGNWGTATDPGRELIAQGAATLSDGGPERPNDSFQALRLLLASETTEPTTDEKIAFLEARIQQLEAENAQIRSEWVAEYGTGELKSKPVKPTFIRTSDHLRILQIKTLAAGELLLSPHGLSELQILDIVPLE